MFSSCLRRCCVLLLTLICTNVVTAQTPGLIVRPTPPLSSPSVLDPNRDGFISPTTSGFVNTDVGTGYSEIAYKIIPPFKLEPTSDLMRGPNERFSDLVRISNDESGLYIFNDGTNLLFRLRLGDIVSGSKGYSILIDADGLFGASGPNADPNYKAATSGINGNPGFELEVVLETNFRVAIYNLDGKDDAGNTPASTYGINTNAQVSIAASSVSGTPDYLYDFYVPLADLKYGTSGQVTATTPIRVSATTVMSPQAAVGGPKSDIYGYDGTDYMKAWETIINGQPAFTPNAVTSAGSGISALICTAAPTLTSPITAGATTFTGTWTRLDETRSSTATITLYRGNSAVGSITATSGVPWSITVTAANAAAATNVFYVTALGGNGESACYKSNSVTVPSCVVPTTIVRPSFAATTPSGATSSSCASNRGFRGFIPNGTTIEAYFIPTSTSTSADLRSGTDLAIRPSTATNANYIAYSADDAAGTGYKFFYLNGPTENGNSFNDPCSGGNSDFTQGNNYVFYTKTASGCVSAPTVVCIVNNGQITTPATNPVQITNPSGGVIYPSATTLSGTSSGLTSGNLIRLYVNGTFIGSAVAGTGGAFSFSNLSLTAGDKILLYDQVSATACMTRSVDYTVNCYVQPPIINTTNGQIRTGNPITGTSSEAAGTTINIYDAAASTTIAATATVLANGTWSTGSFTAVGGRTYYAVATKSCGTSLQSANATTVSANATVRCGTINAVAESATAVTVSGTLSGTAVASTKVRLLANGVAIDSVTTATNSYSIVVNEGYSDYISAGDSLTIEVQESGRLTEVCAVFVKVSCSAPASPVATPTSATVSTSTGRTVISLTGSVSGILYTLENTSGVDQSISVFGTGGTITLNSYAILSPGTYSYRVSAYKLGGTTGCTNAFTSVTLNATDNDGDGVIDPVDIDDDNDGLLDANESATYDATGDGDGDGVANYRDITPGVSGLPVTDSNGDGVLDYFDTDRDGIINQFDLDADNDGIPDIAENGGTDSDNDGKVDGATDSDSDGLRNAADATPSTGAAGSNGLSVQDFDGDGVPNFRDLDSDGDGMLDSRESGLNRDTNNDGVINSTDTGHTDTNNDGWTDFIDNLSTLSPTNTDARAGANYLDIDSDDDGIVDNTEGQSTTGYIAPRTTAPADADGDGINDAYDNNTASFGGISNNGITPVNSDTDALADYLDLDSDNDGYPDAFEGHDTDGDNLPNSNTATKNGSGGTADVDGDGLLDGYDNNTSAVNPANGTTSTSYPNVDGGASERDWREAADSDRDGVPDAADLDDDNDGIPDLIESGGVNGLGDADGDGILNYQDPAPGTGVSAFADVNGDGISDAFDSDRDGIINLLDLDSDNDGISDVVEAGGVDANGDGRIDNFTDTDGDGLSQHMDANNTGAASSGNGLAANTGLADFDGDGVANIFDLDSDNDGIPDLAEAGGVDANGDGRIDSYRDSDGDGLDSRVDGDANNDGATENTTGALIITGADNNNDGKADAYPQGIFNTDGRGMPNAYDLDSDDDGIPDLIEAGGTDADNNGRVDVFADADGDGFADARDGDVGNDGTSENLANVLIPTGADANNDGKADSYPKANADGASLPNPYDLDSDNDGIPDLIEQGGVDTNGDGMIDSATETNNNGWADAYDPTIGGINLKTLDANDNAVGGAIFDFDGDGVANYLDLDSDGDGIPDIVEQGGTDSNNDGMTDTATDVDQDGFADAVDPVNNRTNAALGTALITTGATLTSNKLPGSYSAGDDFDGKGLINMLDLDSDGDGILDVRDAGLPDADGNGLADGTTGADGWSDTVDALAALNLPNSDNRGGVNFLDIDSDDDGITDNVEGQTTAGYKAPADLDDDMDGIDNEYDNNDALYAGNNNNGIVPNDHDSDTTPDYIDTDTDNDTDLDVIEGNDLNLNGRADDLTSVIANTDADGDGLLDFFDLNTAAPLVTVAGFGNGLGSKSTAQRTITTFTNRDWRNAAFSLTAQTLPVRFVSVAVNTATSGNQLKWMVTGEVNVLHYEVERSLDGSRFEQIASVDYRLATAATNTYQYLDGGARYPVAYYRIRQVDADGKWMYSTTVLARANENQIKAALQLYPNPATTASMVVIEARSNQQVQLMVADMHGRIVARQVLKVQKGNNVIPAALVAKLSSGTYVLLAEVNGALQQVKFVKQ